MKKFLLSAAAVLAFTGNAPAMEWALIGGYNDWDPATALPMTEITENVYEITVESLEGEFKFIGDRDWSNNYGCYDIAAIYGNGTVKANFFGNNFTTEGTLENVTITLDTVNSRVTFSGLPIDMENLPDPDQVIYKEGHFIIGDPAGEWNPAVGIPMEEVAENVYEWTGYILGGQYFAFTCALIENAEDPWTLLKDYRYGAVTEEGTPVFSGNVEVIPGQTSRIDYPSQGDMSWTIEKTGLYTLTLDHKNRTLTCSENQIVWGLCGSFNGWGETPDIDMTEDESGIWSAEVKNLSGEFKLRANSEWNLNIGKGDTTDVLVGPDGEYNCWYNADNFIVDGTLEHIKVSFDPVGMKLTTNIPTEVQALTITSDLNSGDAVFFNMQGMRVANPEKGMYIRVAGGKAEKVRI